MGIGQFVHQFAHDDKVVAAVLVVALDFVVGVLAALKMKTFTFARLVDFAKDDILFKLVPYGVLYAFALYAGNQQVLVSFIDLGDIAGVAYVGFMTAWAASIASSLIDLGIGKNASPKLKSIVGR